MKIMILCIFMLPLSLVGQNTTVLKSTQDTSQMSMAKEDRIWFFQAGLGFNFFNPENKYLGGVKTEARFLYKIYPEDSWYLTFSTGYEVISGYRPFTITPLSIGCQTTFWKRPGQKIQIYGNFGYGFATVEDVNQWETIKIRGNLRYEGGLVCFPGIGKNNNIFIGSNIVFQKVELDYISTWSHVRINQYFKRIFINFGVLF